jgi:hypothetical protein
LNVKSGSPSSIKIVIRYFFRLVKPATSTAKVLADDASLLSEATFKLELMNLPAIAIENFSLNFKE